MTARSSFRPRPTASPSTLDFTTSASPHPAIFEGQQIGGGILGVGTLIANGASNNGAYTVGGICLTISWVRFRRGGHRGPKVVPTYALSGPHSKLT